MQSPQYLEKQLARFEKIPFAAITVGDVVGKGRFKKVHQGRYNGRDVVVLRYVKDTKDFSRSVSPTRNGSASNDRDSKDEDKNYNELKILCLLSKKGSEAFVPEIYGVCHENHSTIIVQEFAAWQNLKDLLKKSGVKVTNLHKLQCGSQMSRAMAFLESKCVVHADLSARNVLMFRFEEDPSLLVAKVSDFGLSCILKEGTDSVLQRQPQATRWCAPETVSLNKLSHRADMWSLGVTMWEIYADGVAPWPCREGRADVAAQLRVIAEKGASAEGGDDVSGDFPRSDCCPVVVHSVILSCMKADEYARPRFTALAMTLDNIIEEGGETGGQLEDVEVSFSEHVESSSGDAGDIDLTAQLLMPPVKERLSVADTPQWLAYCAWAAVDKAAAGRLEALCLFADPKDRDLLVDTENRLKRRAEQIASLRKGAAGMQAFKTPVYPPYSYVPGFHASTTPSQAEFAGVGPFTPVHRY